MDIQQLITNIVVVIGALAAYISNRTSNPIVDAYETALSKAILAGILEETTEPLSRQEIVERFRSVAQDATTEEEANTKLASLPEEKIWYMASQVNVRGATVTMHDGGLVEVE